MASARQSPLVLYLIMVFGFAMGWLYLSQSDPARNVPQIPASFQLTNMRQLQNLRIDFSLLSDPQFLQLRSYGELPVEAGAGGKINPFQ